MGQRIKFLDTTLRDGEQAPGCSMEISEKIEIAKLLERLRIDYIEAGFPTASNGDFEAVKQISHLIKRSSVVALARATVSDVQIAWDAIKDAVRPMLHIFIATSEIHMMHKLGMSREDVLKAIKKSVTYAKTLCENIEFSAEDATRSDRTFLKEALEVAIESGATIIDIPDTVGYSIPNEFRDLIIFVKENVKGIDKVALSVHCHNDMGLAVANTLTGIECGVTQVECTLNGMGERAGNAAFEEVAMALYTRQDILKAKMKIDTTQIYRACKRVQSIVGWQIPPNKPIIGANAFLHEAGIHQHGMLQDHATYQVMQPSVIGVPENIMVLGKHSGRHAFDNRLYELGYKLNKNDLNDAFIRFKNLADKKKTISDFDIEAIVANKNSDSFSRFNLVSFVINSGNTISSTALVKLEYRGVEYEKVAIGDGPIDAAFKAINKAVDQQIQLDDYSLNSVTEGEDALGEAIVKLKKDEIVVVGRGLSTDVVEASILAYLNGVSKLYPIN